MTFDGLRGLVLRNLAHDLGISLDDLKERIETKTERQKDRDLMHHT